MCWEAARKVQPPGPYNVRFYYLAKNTLLNVLWTRSFLLGLIWCGIRPVSTHLPGKDSYPVVYGSGSKCVVGWSTPWLTEQSGDVEQMLGHCCRRWANIKSTLDQRLISWTYIPAPSDTPSPQSTAHTGDSNSAASGLGQRFRLRTSIETTLGQR